MCGWGLYVQRAVLMYSGGWALITQFWGKRVNLNTQWRLEILKTNPSLLQESIPAISSTRQMFPAVCTRETFFWTLHLSKSVSRWLERGPTNSVLSLSWACLTHPRRISHASKSILIVSDLVSGTNQNSPPNERRRNSPPKPALKRNLPQNHPIILRRLQVPTKVRRAVMNCNHVTWSFRSWLWSLVGSVKGRIIHRHNLFCSL